MELRPFRSLRLSPRAIEEVGLATWIAPPADRVGPDLEAELSSRPRNVLALTLPAWEPDAAERAAATLAAWRADGTLSAERRPCLWIDRQTPGGGGPSVSLLIGLVRLGRVAQDVEASPEPEPRRTPAERVALRRALRADFEPCLLVTKAPLTGALDTTRRPDLSVTDRAGVRHDAFRVADFAQHVNLQGLVKNAEVVLLEGRSLWEAAQELEADPASAKLPGARYKLCAVADEERLRERRRAGENAPPTVPAGLFGVSLEDPVY